MYTINQGSNCDVIGQLGNANLHHISLHLIIALFKLGQYT